MVYLRNGYAMISPEPDTPPSGSWVVKVETCGGRDYIHIDRTNLKCAQALNSNWGMLDAIIWLRNQATNSLMSRLSLQEDPLAGGGASSSPEGNVPKRPRKQMLDEIDEAVEIKVKLQDGSAHTMWVLTAASHRATLGVHLTDENLKVLAEGSPSGEDGGPPVAPTVNVPFVTWVRHRSCVRTQYYAAGKWHTKSMKVKPGPDFHARVKKMANVCAAFRREHNCEGGGEQPDEVASEQPDQDATDSLDVP